MIDLRKDSCHGRLTSSGIAKEHHVICNRRRLQSILLTDLTDLQQIDHIVDLRLHALHAGQLVQLLK